MHRYAALLKIIELGSFTKAAEVLGYTQPAISQMVASLEKELSFKLLSRTRYGVSPTPEGEQLLPSIRSAVARYNSMRAIASEIKGMESGIVRIGSISSVSCHWLPPIVRGFWQQYPNVTLQLRQADSATIAEDVRNGDLDFAFVNPNAVPGMTVRPLKNGDFKAIIPMNHPLAQKKSVTLQELASEPFLLLEGVYSDPMDAFHKAGLEPRVALRLPDDYSVLSMVEQGLGVSILADLVLKKTAYRVAALPLDPVITREIGLVSKEKNALSLAAKYFIEYLNKAVPQLP